MDEFTSFSTLRDVFVSAILLFGESYRFVLFVFCGGSDDLVRTRSSGFFKKANPSSVIHHHVEVRYPVATVSPVISLKTKGS